MNDTITMNATLTKTTIESEMMKLESDYLTSNVTQMRMGRIEYEKKILGNDIIYMMKTSSRYNHMNLLLIRSGLGVYSQSGLIKSYSLISIIMTT